MIQRRRRGEELAQGVSPGKAINQSPFRAAAGPRAAEGEARYEPKAHYGKIDQPMNQKLEPLNSNEVLWLQTQLENAIKFVERFSTPPLTLAALDRAFAAWLAGPPPADINGIINCVPPSVETRHCRVSLSALGSWLTSAG